MNYVNKDFVFDTETGINKQEIEALLLHGVVLKFYLIKDDFLNEWFVKVTSSNGSSGYFINSRERMKRFSSLDTAVRQLSELAPDVPVSIYR